VGPGLGLAGGALDAHARRAPVRSAVLVERLCVDAVGVALHHQRTIGDDREEVRRDADVVAEQVALGQLQRGPEDLAEVRHLEPVAAGELEDAVARAVRDRIDLREQPAERRFRQPRRDGAIGRVRRRWGGPFGSAARA